MDQLTAVPSARLVDTVYEKLREAIFAGQLPPGSRLRVPLLAEKLEVSRSPIREAVLRLTREGLAVEESRRGVVVASISNDDLIELYHVREVLEGLAARLAADNADPVFLGELGKAIAAHGAALDAQDVLARNEANVRFHSLISEQARNADLILALRNLQAKVRLAMRTTRVIGGPVEALEDHRRILAALEAGDPEAAEAASRKHVAKVRMRLCAARELEKKHAGNQSSAAATNELPA